MRRLLMVVAVSLLALQASGLASWLLPGDCAESCPDDSDGTCPPTCNCCTCCFHPRSLARTEALRPAATPAVERVLALDGERHPEAPPVREIFHVPKRARA